MLAITLQVLYLLLYVFFLTLIARFIMGYVLTFGLVLVPMGRLGDLRSRKALFVIGLSLFGLRTAAADERAGPGLRR